MHCPRRFTLRAARRNVRLDIAVAAITSALALAACRSNEPGNAGTPSETRASALSAVPATASAIVAALRARPGSPVQTGVAQSFDAVAGGLRPQFAASATAAEPAPARMTLPQLGTGAVHLEDAQTGTAVDVSLRGALPAAAQSSDGYVVYSSALASGATVLERALPSGTEDFVNFDTRPATPAIAYDVALGPGVSGLRLVAGTLEMLDAGGAPRLRVSPPYVVGADGARTDAVLAVAGCAIDTSPAAPWGRPVTAPGAKTCTVNVTWPDQAVVYPALLDPRWTTTGSMGTARQDHTMTLLATGKALVTGGRSSPGTTGLATAELYDKASGTWAATGSMTGGRFLHRATQLNTSSNTTTSGKVLISGGLNGTTSLSTAQLYSPTAGTWIAAGNLNAVRHGHAATLLADGRVLAAGGLNGTATLATAAIYTPGTSGAGTWAATTGPLPPTGQKNHTAILLVTTNSQLNNKVLLVGGNSGTATLAAVYLFDPAQSAFSTLASIPTPREQHTMTVLANGKVLVTGGKNGSTTLNTAIVFDPGFGPGSWSSAGTMTAARYGHTATLLPASIVANGQVLVAGGSSGSTTLSSAELLSGTSTWTATPSMPAPVQGHTATLLGSNMLLVAGGLNGTTVLSAARLYDASFGLGCSSNSQCASGFCANGICCDTACNTGTCSACNLAGHLGTCTPLANGTVCRAPTGPCDVAETCNGTAVTCPSDGVAPLGTVCRSAPGACDVPETCNGTTKVCPADGFAPATTLCRAPTSACDAPEKCTGTSATCPSDTFAPAGTVCRPAAGGCDAAESCTGTSAVCPADGLASAGTVCRPAQSLCDIAETCSGSSAVCPADTFAAAGTTCGAATGGAPAPVCSGSTGTCSQSSGTSDVLGFEAVANWAFAPSATATIVGLNPSRTQGASSLEVTAQGNARLNSAAVSSIGGVGPIILLDIQLPTNQANPSSYGDAQMFVNSPSLGISNVSLGDIQLTGLALGNWQTLAFQMPAATASTIAQGVYSDLTFSVTLNVPTNETGHYLLDNIRPMRDVVPSLLGIAQDGSTLKAVFDYLTTSSTPVTIPYGTGNGLRNQSGFIASPTEFPPTTFLATTHAPFVATLSGSLLTWTVGSHSATATSGSNQLPVTTLGDGTHDATLPDGRKVNLDSVPPPNPANAAGPPVGAAFNGVLTGQFSVSPSGAATYTVPISIPPGIAGMAPNLALVYNSQGGEGIAGQGWNLAGLSSITRCPRTRQQDGYGRPVMMDSLTPSGPGAETDGICLDGGKLFEQPAGSGNYVSETQDFSTITHTTADDFHVVTKAGETRYYGRLNAAKVASNVTAIWLLDRVVDAWGNYFDIHYNNDQGNGSPTLPNSFTASGVWVSKIDYTGSLTNPNCAGATPQPTCTFASVTFQYRFRNDLAGERWHWTRYGALRIPQNQLLTSITTDMGTYSLTYPTGSTELTSIGYCAGGTCMNPLTFGWQNTDNPPDASGYALPSFVGPTKGLKGTQFVDINGDGRADFVLARTNGSGGNNIPQTVLNTGSGWGDPLTGTGQTFPLYLSDASDKPTPVRFADIDGDGLVDVVVDSANVTCTGGTGSVCVSCKVGEQCPGSTPHSPAVWLNRFTVDGGGGWEFHSEYSGPSVSFTGANPTMVADVDGDGKADLVQVSQQDETDENGNITQVDILITAQINNTAQVNNGTVGGWSLRTGFLGKPPGVIPLGGPFQVEDLNRDGLADIVRRQSFAYQDGSAASTETILINEGTNPDGTIKLGAPITHNAPSGGHAIDVINRPPQFADIDGDGFYDLVAYAAPYWIPDWITPNFSLPTSVAAVGYGRGTGYGFGDDVNPGLYFNVLRAFTPQLGTDYAGGEGAPEDYGYALVDIDGDGLVDLVRNHWNRLPGGINPGLGGGEILLNTGRTWVSVAGNTGWQVSAGTGRIPFAIPSKATEASGSAFVDLDGDGMVDLVQEEDGGSNLGAGAWINPRRRQVIRDFPNGLAKSTIVTYVSTTSTAGASTYKDDDAITEANTKRLAVPLNVVSSVFAEDASGTGVQSTATYTYHSLRQDAFGRGPLGFHRVEIFNQASQVRMVTTYAQAHPYTGMPTEVDKYQVVEGQSHLTNKTTTSYCDTATIPAPPGLGCGPPPQGPIPPGTIPFVHPSGVTDIAYLHPENDDLSQNTTTVSIFSYDQHGNATSTTTTITKTEGGATESFAKTVQNTYTTLEELIEGKPDSTVVTGIGGTAATTHTTTFEYAPTSSFGGAGSRLALVKKHVEPGADWPTRLDTAYFYDEFGNVVTTTSCASDFTSCVAGATNPSGASDPIHHPPFRTTTASYDPSALGVSYGRGRFPVTITNAVGHTETTVYDPVLGKILTKTGPNGIKTCYTYDRLGRGTSETDRCGSAAPLVSTTQYFRTLPRSSVCPDPPCTPGPTGFSPPNSAVVTVATPPTGAPSWSYSDDQGKSTGSLAYAFDGGFIETTTAYNALGQVTQVAKPLHLATVADQPVPSYTKTFYDDFHRVHTVTDPLGVIDGSGVSQSTTIITTYNGSTLQTDRQVNGQTQTRLETKNAIGKVAAVTTQTETGAVKISYDYDADGNLTNTTDPTSNHVQIGYDARGRKIFTNDPDMGSWAYTVDGFGDLIGQKDAKSQLIVMTYDRLGRMLTKTDCPGGSTTSTCAIDPSTTAQWVYDTAPGAGKGKLAAMVSAPDVNLAGPCTTIPLVTVTGGNRAGKSFQYTAFGDVQEIDECADGSTFATTYQYDGLARQSLVRYPAVGNSQLAVGYHYTSLGYLQYLTDESSDYGVLWQAKAMNALGQVTDEQMRNGVETVSNRNPLTGWLLGSTATAHADGDKLIQNWSYGFDELGNLLARNRADAVNLVTSSETFTYDLTNRLTASLVTTSGGYNHPETYFYDALGNITQKSGSGYTYGAGCLAGTGAGARAAGPHAVCTVAGGTPFTYDGNGNLTANASRSASYNSANKVTHVESDPTTSQGNDTGAVDFIYGADQNRVVQAVSSGGVTSRTVYVGLGATGKSLYERTTTGAAVQHVNFIYAGAAHGGSAFALRVLDNSGAVTANKYYSFDHLGSVTAMSDDLGRVATAQTAGPDATALGYDAWGARRNPDGTAANPVSFNLPVGHREYTGQEQIPYVSLVNMNGRLYDPSLGRFLSPDPNVQFVADLESYNRYAYAANNPLRYTDPTGYFFSELGSFFKNTFTNPVAVLQMATSLAVCAATGGAGCLVVGLMWAAVNSSIAITNGAGFDQTILNASIGLGIGVATGGLGLGGWQGFVLGSASAAVTTMLANKLSGQKVLGYNVLGAALLSAAQGAATLGLQRVIAASRASTQGGGGSGEARLRSGGDDADCLFSCIGEDPATNRARAEAEKNGEVYEGRVRRLPVRIYGGTSEQRQDVADALYDVLGGKSAHGVTMRQALESNTSFFGLGADPEPLDVVLVSDTALGSHSHLGVLTLDLSDVGTSYPSLSGSGLYTYNRIIAHELGHIALDTGDIGPGRMLNVSNNENVVMRQLGNYDDRTAY